MKNTTYLDALKKVDEHVSNNEIIKILYTELIKLYINKKDYVGLVNKTAGMFEISLDDAQMLLHDVSKSDNLADAWKDIGKDVYAFLRLISLTYGEEIYALRKYAFTENKLLISETSLSNYDEKIGLDFKRIDGESFYAEMNFNGMAAFASQVMNVFTDNVKEDKISHHNDAFFDQALQLRAAATLLARTFESKRTAEGGEVDDGNTE